MKRTYQSTLPARMQPFVKQRAAKHAGPEARTKGEAKEVAEKSGKKAQRIAKESDDSVQDEDEWRNQRHATIANMSKRRWMAYNKAKRSPPAGDSRDRAETTATAKRGRPSRNLHWPTRYAGGEDDCRSAGNEIFAVSGPLKEGLAAKPRTATHK